MWWHVGTYVYGCEFTGFGMDFKGEIGQMGMFLVGWGGVAGSLLVLPVEHLGCSVGRTDPHAADAAPTILRRGLW